MYSVILMAAMTTGGDVTAWPFGRGGHGCCGGYVACSGCWGCNGCYGCNGCNGCDGCWGGCHGCHGCHGGWGHTYAGVGYYGYGCWGYGCHNCNGYYGCYGAWTGYGGYYCTGTPHVFSMVPISPAGPLVPPGNGKLVMPDEPNPEKKGAENKGEEKKGEGGEKKGEVPPEGLILQQISLTPDRAKLIVTLPADARLFVDNQPMQTPSEVRVFHTPELRPGQLYYYTVRAEVVRDGRTISREQRVVVRAGSVTRAAFTELPGAPVMTAQK
jgi:uncharacterized protein (TIGR03000 family)